MKKECEIVQDLLPAYMGHFCTDTSRAYVEAHLAECNECKKLMEASAQDNQAEKIMESLPNAESVLRKTSWKLHKKAILDSLGITAIVLYWLVYLWAKIFADQGDYRYFSWSFWEAFSAGSVYIPILTAVWVVILVVQSLRKKTWKKNIVVGLILLLLLGAQFGYLHSRSNVVYVDNWTTVESIPDEYHIVIHTDTAGDGTILLKTNPTITRLVKTDGTVYGFQYESKKNNPDEGVLRGVWGTVD